MPRHRLLLLFAFVLCCAVVRAEGPPPVAAVRNVDSTFFGTTVADPYRYFEDRSAPEVARWMKAHSDRAHATLAKIPGRAALLAAPRQVRRSGAGESRATGARARRSVLLRKARREREPVQALHAAWPGGRRPSAGRSRGDAEENRQAACDQLVLRRRPTAAMSPTAFRCRARRRRCCTCWTRAPGKPVGAPITRTDFGGIDWSPDGKTLLFNRLRAMPGMRPSPQKYQNSQIYRLPLGRPVEPRGAGVRHRGFERARSSPPSCRSSP